ncbi:DotG/IcmE/VirB10 family protein [Cysteiniphilum litorale]|uniref:DotG/IcmE/VirB10 family protein n=1 Tax=Cysteiniphilum litorale TaxID=2056700 RepID=UPI003F880AC4
MLKAMLKFFAQHPRIKILCVFLGSATAIIIGISVFSNSSKTYLSSSINNEIAPNQPNNLHKGAYDKLIQQQNKEDISQAKQSQDSYIENIFSTNGQDDHQQASKSEDPKSFYQQQASKKDKNSPSPIASQVQEWSNSDNSSSLQAEQNNFQQLINVWNKVPTMQQVVINNGDNTATDASTARNGAVLLKAGDILFAVLNTALNSDQANTPVLATIVVGNYKGAKLLGSFERQEDKLVVKFSRMSIPGANSSMAINAYAIDQNTAQSAMATSVNHHYLLRYGSLFSAAFLQGFGTYFSNGQNSACPPNATICINTQKAAVTTQNAAYAGLGQIGSALSNAMAQQFNMPPTVKLAQGSAIGILIMDDVRPGKV